MNEPMPFEPYSLVVSGEHYTVLEPSEPTAHRVERLGKVIGVPCADSSQPLTVVALEDFFDNPPVVLATAADIKAEAGRRILEIAPSWKQANMIARTLELTNAHGADPATWPAPEQTERATYLAVWEQIKAIRTYSDTLEANPPALADLPAAFEAVLAP